jgi:uncharacterized cysteine cluster protein YcgN (CxxCxxCC family)
VQLTPQNVHAYGWLPDSCAYRRVALNLPLFWWHPLVSKQTHTVHDARISVRGRTIGEEEVDIKDLELYAIAWINPSE